MSHDAVIAGGGRSGRIGKSADGREIHFGVQCDVCGRRDIVGLRFKSDVLPDYDLCEQCRLRPEATAQAPFTRVKPPGGWLMVRQNWDLSHAIRSGAVFAHLNKSTWCFRGQHPVDWSIILHLLQMSL